MFWKNPYIEKIQAHTDIFENGEEIFSHAGKWSQYFGNNHPIILEIGTGMGNFFGKLVGENPDKNFIGIELRYKRLFSTAQKAKDACIKRTPNISSFVVLKTPGQNISKIFCQQELSETYIFFPDPWASKTRHKKHRLIELSFLQELGVITKLWGKLYFKTDHREYFEEVLSFLPLLPEWKKVHCSFDYGNDTELFDMKNITEFEALYRGQKKDICYLELVKKGSI